MPYTGANIETDVANILNRNDTSTLSLITLAVKSAHQKLQGMRDWDAQRKTYRRLQSGVGFNFAIPSDFKSARQLFQVTGTNLSSDLIPAIPASAPINMSPYYQKTSFESVLAQRALIQQQTTNTLNRNTILAQALFFTVENGLIELVPKLNNTTDQIALTYFAIVPYTAGTSDWFTDKCFEYLTLEATLFTMALLGEVDARQGIWQNLAKIALDKAMGFDIGIDIGGDALVMRG